MSIVSLIGNPLEFTASQTLTSRNSMVFTDAACSGVLGADIGFDYARSATAKVLNSRAVALEHNARTIQLAITNFSGCTKVADLRFGLDNTMKIGIGLGFVYGTEVATSVKSVGEVDGNAYFLPVSEVPSLAWNHML